MSESRIASTRDELRLVLGFALLPPAAGLLMFVTCLAPWSMGAWIFEGTPSVDAAVSFGIAVAIIAVVVIAVIVISILVIQFVSGTVSSDVGRLWFGWRGAIRAIALGLWFGTTMATLLWAMAIRR